MNAIDKLHQAEAAAREALRNGFTPWTQIEAALRDLLAALDAARKEAIEDAKRIIAEDFKRVDAREPAAAADGVHVFNCHRCPVSVESRWQPPECPECGDPCVLDASAALAQQPAAAVPEDVARDAARYRWLRNDSGNAFDDPVIQGKYIGSPKVDWLTGEHADEAIDRAMLAAAAIDAMSNKNDG